ncbi:MAG: hypothetical protein H0T62_00300 [Parachlamydiaceae bacterium]|nr:hypothetical protein [Parachlamydiaceae bacterium]
MNDTQTEWLTYAKKSLTAQGNTFVMTGENCSYLLECKQVGILSPELANFKKELSEIAAQKVSESELSFLKLHPEAASSELFLKACKPLLEVNKENPDWNLIKEMIKSSVKQFYLADLSIFGPEAIKPLLEDLYFCATIKDSDERKTLGFLLFSITPALPYGDVKVINYFLTNERSSSELQKILMGFIVKILPETKRIFLFARPTDTSALKLYASLGFKNDETPFHDPNHKINHPSMTSLEYRIENSKILQSAVNLL